MGTVPFSGRVEVAIMDITRNQYFFAGLLCLMLGLQLHSVESFELTADFTQFLAERTGHPLAPVNGAAGTPAKNVCYPPDWIGWSLISVGAVLALHSFGMKKPGS
jgi:hypothetical protein